MMTLKPEISIERIETAAYRIPTERPEADGTYEWTSTTLVTVDVYAGGRRGFGYSYGSVAMTALIRDQLAGVVVGHDALSVSGALRALVREVRNTGRPGIASTAISAIDTALWDLKGKLLNQPLVGLLGEVRDAVPVYGSGGFTNASIEQLCSQLISFADAGMRRVKMKIGADAIADAQRARAARHAIGGEVELMVDANGAYKPYQAIEHAQMLGELGVSWLEEPVSSDDVAGLAEVRRRAPEGLAIAAGEYGYDAWYFRALLERGAVDVLQADATRCLGITGFMSAAALCEAFRVPLSAHTAPSVHAHAGCALTPVVHIEYFFDHARIERMLFDGFIEPVGGCIAPDRSRPGIGVELKREDAARYAIAGGTS